MIGRRAVKLELKFTRRDGDRSGTAAPMRPAGARPLPQCSVRMRNGEAETDGVLGVKTGHRSVNFKSQWQPPFNVMIHRDETPRPGPLTASRFWCSQRCKAALACSLELKWAPADGRFKTRVRPTCAPALPNRHNHGNATAHVGRRWLCAFCELKCQSWFTVELRRCMEAYPPCRKAHKLLQQECAQPRRYLLGHERPLCRKQRACIIFKCSAKQMAPTRSACE